MQYQWGFIGCGNMGGTLVRAVAKNAKSGEIAVCDLDETKTEALAKACGAVVEDLETIVRESRFLVLGVKPQAMEKTLSPVRGKIGKDTILVTMAAGVTIERLRSYVGAYPVVRIMPNTPAALGEGVILYCTDGVNGTDEADFQTAFAAAGLVDKLDESEIDAAGALSGCGPAFVYYFAEALIEGAVASGLSREKAEKYAAQTLVGGGKMLQTYGDPVVLRKAVCSPNGTTLAGIGKMEELGFKMAAEKAVEAAYRRTLELQRGE